MSSMTTLADDRPTTVLASRGTRKPRVAYLMSRFPKLTETFVLFEMLAVEQQGLSVDVYPLLGADNGAATRDGATVWQKFRDYLRPNRHGMMHTEAEPFVRRAHYLPFLSFKILLDQLPFLLRHPLIYFASLWLLVRGAWGNWNFLLGGLASFPKTVAFARQMQQDGIQHIHAHFANHPALAALIIHRLTGIPYSFTAHGSDLHRDKRLLREKVTGAKFVVTISDYNRRVIEEHGGPLASRKTVVVHCGVDTSRFRAPALLATEPALFSPESDRNEFDRCSTELALLCVGTLHEVKGQPHLIDACAQLVARGVRFRCQFLGDGPDREKLQQQIDRLGLQQHVELLGPKTRQEVIDLLQSAQILVAPSVPSRSGRREGIPVVLMEGMACHLAVIASDLSGIPELVQHEETGLLVSPGDHLAIADAIQRLERDPSLRRRLGDAARQKVVLHFDLMANARRLTELIEKGE